MATEDHLSRGQRTPFQLEMNDSIGAAEYEDFSFYSNSEPPSLTEIIDNEKFWASLLDHSYQNDSFDIFSTPSQSSHSSDPSPTSIFDLPPLSQTPALSSVDGAEQASICESADVTHLASSHEGQPISSTNYATSMEHATAQHEDLVDEPHGKPPKRLLPHLEHPFKGPGRPEKARLFCGGNCPASFERAWDLKRREQDIHAQECAVYRWNHAGCPYTKRARRDKVLEHCRRHGDGSEPVKNDDAELAEAKRFPVTRRRL